MICSRGNEHCRVRWCSVDSVLYCCPALANDSPDGAITERRPVLNRPVRLSVLLPDSFLNCSGTIDLNVRIKHTVPIQDSSAVRSGEGLRVAVGTKRKHRRPGRRAGLAVDDVMRRVGGNPFGLAIGLWEPRFRQANVTTRINNPASPIQNTTQRPIARSGLNPEMEKRSGSGISVRRSPQLAPRATGRCVQQAYVSVRVESKCVLACSRHLYVKTQ